jgi:hypothetical protein
MPAAPAKVDNLLEGNLPGSANLVQTLIKHDLVDAFLAEDYRELRACRRTPNRKSINIRPGGPGF